MFAATSLHGLTLLNVAGTGGLLGCAIRARAAAEGGVHSGYLESGIAGGGRNRGLAAPVACSNGHNARRRECAR